MKYTTKLFAQIKIGESFIEVLSPVNLTAVRIEPVTDKTGRTFNARRSNGTLVHMVEWEPVLIEAMGGHRPRKEVKL